MSDDEYEAIAFKFIAVGEEGGYDEQANEPGWDLFEELYHDHVVTFHVGWDDLPYRMPVMVKKLMSEAKLPTRGSDQAAGYDLYALTTDEVHIMPHTTEKIGTGLAMAIPDGYFGGIYPRSGLATKKGIRPANCVGVIDSDYR